MKLIFLQFSLKRSLNNEHDKDLPLSEYLRQFLSKKFKFFPINILFLLDFLASRAEPIQLAK